MSPRWIIPVLVVLWAPSAHARLFSVRVENGRRTTSTGDLVDYTLYVPELSRDLPAPPWPAVVLSHGFARSRRHHRRSAYYMARRGIIVLTPDLVGFGGIQARERNVSATVNHLDWLRCRSRKPQDPLYGRVDPHRMALAGHSAGGAVSLEAAVVQQSTPFPIRALSLLDAVPWPTTLARAPLLHPLRLSSLRSEPAPCNADGSVLQLLGELGFAAEDVRIVGGTHCDPENPSDLLCRAVCGGSDATLGLIYMRLTYLFLQDALDIPSLEVFPSTYEGTLDWLCSRGYVDRSPAGSPE